MFCFFMFNSPPWFSPLYGWNKNCEVTPELLQIKSLLAERMQPIASNGIIQRKPISFDISGL